MKQHSWLALIGLIFSVTVLAGCSGKFEEKTKILNFNGNPTTGYTWTYEVEPEGIIDVLSDVTYLGDWDTVGAPSLFTYTLTSLKEGNCDLVFSYKRPWEKKKPEKEIKYKVTVTKSGKIKMR